MIEFFRLLKLRFDNTPEKIAAKNAADETTLTYGQIDDLSGRIYNYLKSEGFGREDFILLCMPRDVRIMAAMVGVWKAGAACIICEDTMAPERLRYIASDSGSVFTITDENWGDIIKMPYLEGRQSVAEHDAAFVVYTSGTTGNPKGVVHEYGNMDRSISTKKLDGELLIDENTVLAMNSPLNFVAFVDHFLNVMAYGGEFLLVETTRVKNPDSLIELYEKEGVTYTFMTPSLYKTIGNFNSQMKLLAVGGEPCVNLYTDKFILLNSYSCSEAGRDIFTFHIKQPYSTTPVGTNKGGEEILLITEDGKIADIGETGEICYENNFVRGYINLEEKTKAAWRDGLYHSGDLGVRLPDGNVVVKGRNDDMIKINGNRIEPAEIEATAKRTLNLNWACAKGFVTEKSSFVVLYYTGDSRLDPQQARCELAKNLPSYMIPSYFVLLDEIPLLPNGKVNKKELKIPNIDDYRAAYEAPSNELEEKLCAVFSEVLEIENIGVNDDFFEIGGDSIHAINAISKAKLPELDVPKLYKFRTVKKLAAALKGQGQTSAEETELFARTHDQPLTPFQTFMFDYQLYSPLSTMYNMYTLLKMREDEIDSERLAKAIETVVKNHTAFATIIYYDEDCKLVQKYAPQDVSIKVEHLTEEEFDQIKQGLVHPFKLLGEYLYRARVFDTGENVYMFLDIHHVVGDGMSLKLLIKNISKAYYGHELKEDYFYTFLYEHATYPHSDSYNEAKAYYEKAYAGKEWTTYIKPDYQSRKNTMGIKIFEPGIEAEEFDAFCKKNGLSKNAYFIAVSLLTLSAITRKDDVMTAWTYSGRGDQRKESSIGLIAAQLPVAVSFKEINTTEKLFAAIKEQIGKGIEYSFYPYLLDRIRIAEDDTFCIQEQTGVRAHWGLRDVPFEPIQFIREDESSCYLMLFQIVGSDILQIWLSYISQLYSKETVEKVEKLLNYYSCALYSCKEDDAEEFKKLRDVI